MYNALFHDNIYNSYFKKNCAVIFLSCRPIWRYILYALLYIHKRPYTRSYHCATQVNSHRLSTTRQSHTLSLRSGWQWTSTVLYKVQRLYTLYRSWVGSRTRTLNTSVLIVYLEPLIVAQCTLLTEWGTRFWPRSYTLNDHVSGLPLDYWLLFSATGPAEFWLIKYPEHSRIIRTLFDD